MKKEVKDEVAVQNCTPLRSLLDSRLIVATNITEYNAKIINCHNYIQVYFFSKTKEKKDINLVKVDTDDLVKPKTNTSNTNVSDFSIEAKNINRSKLQCQRLAKCNCDEWKTFITLTIAENITDIDIANRKLKYFLDKVRRKYKELKYIGIPEFQKRGAVHYHLLTNISINNTDLIYTQQDNKYFKHIKYWNDGFTKVDTLEKDIKKIIGYISKYMTKDIDNRLFNRHRYFYSRNLKKPIVSYLDLSNNKHFDYYNKILSNKNIIYESKYLNPYTNTPVNFKEFL